MSTYKTRGRMISDFFYNIKDYGAIGDGAANDTAAIQACVTAAAGAPVFAPVGKYLITSPITNINDIPMHIFGSGSGSGPGAAAQQSANVTTFTNGGGSNDLFVVNSCYPSIFRDFHVNNYPATGGTGITLIGGSAANPTATVANYEIRNVGFTEVYRPIRVLRPAWGKIIGCYFDTWVTAPIYLETSSGIEGAGGHIAHNWFFGDAAAHPSQGPCIYSEVGYTIIDGNEILGGGISVNFKIKNFDAGFIKIINNTIENSKNHGILIESADGSLSTMVMIQNNEFSTFNENMVAAIAVAEYTPTPIWIQDIIISGNILRNSMPAGAKYIWIQAGKRVDISGNIIEELGANNPIGVQITGVTISTGLAAPFYVRDNIISGTTTPYSIASNPALQLRDTLGMTVAALPANCGNGTQIYTTDGLKGSNPLTGGSTGTMAFRVNGAWIGF